MNNFPLVIRSSVWTGVEKYVRESVVPVQALVVVVVRIGDPKSIRRVSKLLRFGSGIATNEVEVVTGTIGRRVSVAVIVKTTLVFRIVELSSDIGELDVRVGGRGVLLDDRSGLLVRVLLRTQILLRVHVPQGKECTIGDFCSETGSITGHEELACAQESETLRQRG